MPTVTLSDLAARLKAELVLPAGAAADLTDRPLTGLAPIAHAQDGQVTFLVSDEYARHLETTGATAVIVKAALPSARFAQLVHRNPYWAFAKTAQLFFPLKTEAAGVSAKAHVDPTAEVAASATVYPFAYVGARARIGERAVLYPGVYVGDGAQIGADTVLRANVVVEHGVRIGERCLVHGGAVLGADGFGFAPGEGELAKIPQVGSVVIGDDVEIGGATTVDRGALEDTRLGRGTKLDSHVHVGHGSQTGEYCLMCGLSGLAGSVKLGNWVTVAGHSAVDNRVEMVDGATLGGFSAMTKDAPAKDVYLGFPAQPAGAWRRMIVRQRNLDALEARVKELETKLAALLPAKAP